MSEYRQHLNTRWKESIVIGKVISSPENVLDISESRLFDIVSCPCMFYSQASGAEEGSCEALWGASPEAGGPGNWQRGEQTDCTGYLKAELPGSTHQRRLVSRYNHSNQWCLAENASLNLKHHDTGSLLIRVNKDHALHNSSQWRYISHIDHKLFWKKWVVISTWTLTV